MDFLEMIRADVKVWVVGMDKDDNFPVPIEKTCFSSKELCQKACDELIELVKSLSEKQEESNKE